jgi:hypothetical protein
MEVKLRKRSDSLSAEDHAFWLMVREGLLLLVRAIETRYLAGLKKTSQR